jgi:hypothetical protein
MRYKLILLAISLENSFFVTKNKIEYYYVSSFELMLKNENSSKRKLFQSSFRKLKHTVNKVFW